MNGNFQIISEYLRFIQSQKGRFNIGKKYINYILFADK